MYDKNTVFRTVLSLVAAPFAALIALAFANGSQGNPSQVAASQQPSAERGFPLDQLNAEAQRQWSNQHVGITPTNDGALIKAAMQDLEGEATAEGLWLKSTTCEDEGKSGRLMVRAMAVGRGEISLLPAYGRVVVHADAAAWVRPGLVEEYRASADGVRQDFVIAERPAGRGKLSVALEVRGAKAETTDYGARLTLESGGRELAYHHLHVTDAKGTKLPARMEVADASRLVLHVDDDGALYPVRIDPTFTDADWISMSPTLPAGSEVRALAVDTNANLYVGGVFTNFGNVGAANNVAKWNGSSWSPLGAGVGDASVRGSVNALAVDKSGNLYAGGKFLTAGGLPATNITKWDGSSWSALGRGLRGVNNMQKEDPLWGEVNCLAVDASNSLYVGGMFKWAGDVQAEKIAKWDGRAWSALGSGMTYTDSGGFSYYTYVNCLAVDTANNLYAGGFFKTAGDVEVKAIALWNGSSWSALGQGFEGIGSKVGQVKAVTIDQAGNVYVGGDISKNLPGGFYARHIFKWNGTAWSNLGTGTDDWVTELAVDESGNLYAGGSFTNAGGLPANHIAKWSGTAWSTLGSGTDGVIQALAMGPGGTLYAAGLFATAGGKASPFIAKADISKSSAPEPPPLITSADLASATVGATFNYQITASNSPTSYAASVLPSWLNLDTSTGLMSGTPASAGTYVVTISAANAHGSGTVDLVITVNRASQSIIFNPAAVQKFKKGRKFTLSATATSRLPVSFKSSDSKILSISGRTATIRGKGRVKVTASQAGNANYLPAKPVTRGITIK